MVSGNKELHGKHEQNSYFCTKCGAWKGELGLEPTFGLFIKHLCDIFDEVKRVLKKSGTVWINLGDTYWGGKGSSSGTWDEIRDADRETLQRTHHCLGGKKITRPQDQSGIYPAKSLCQIPSRFAIEMSNPNWVLRENLTHEERQFVLNELVNRGII
jgi:site-specific DNA-methyltransferase (adenine-specific)